jgi:hypothetical protein
MGIIGFLMIAAGTCFVAQAYKAQLTPIVKSRVKSLLDTTRRDDPVTKAAEESFPASDPPAWTPAVGKPAQAEPSV